MSIGEKEVVMQAATTLDRMVDDYLKFLSNRKPYIADRLVSASHVKRDTFGSVVDAVNQTVGIMKMIEESCHGDTSGHRMRQKRVEEIRSIMTVAKAHPDKAIKRLKELPNKRLINA